MEQPRQTPVFEGEVTTEIHINTAAIPPYTRDCLAAATLGLVRNILQQPGGRELLDAKISARNTRKGK